MENTLSPPEYKSCLESKCCSFLNDPSIPKKCEMNWSYDSWTQKYGFYCKRRGERASSKTSALIIMTVVCLVLLYTADIYGRRFIVKLSSILIILGTSVPLIIPSGLLTKMILIGIAAGAEGAFSALFSMIISETSCNFSLKFIIIVPTTKLRSNLISGCFLAYGIGCVVLNLVTFKIKSADNLILVACCLVAVTVIPSFFSFYETPKYLYNAGKFTQLMESLTSIARINGKNLAEKKHFAAGIFLNVEDYKLIDELEKGPYKFEVEIKKIDGLDDEVREYKDGFKLMFTSSK